MSSAARTDRRHGTSPRVLILISTHAVGGPGKNLLNFLRLADDRQRYVLCSFVRRSMGEGEFIRRARRQGTVPQIIEERFAFDPKTLVDAVRLARRLGIGIVQSHEYKSHAVAFVISRILAIPWIAFVHGWTRENRKVELFHSLDRLLLAKATQVVAVSPPLAQEVARLRGGRAPAMIMNGIDAGELEREQGGPALRGRLGVGPRDVLVGTVGRLSREKGQAVLLRAFAAARPRLPDARLVIVGDGPDRAALESLAGELGIAGQTVFAGFQRATADYYEAMDLLVLPSYSEGLPNAVLEAMALGTPVLATRVGGVGEIITDGDNGWLVEPGRPDRMARRLATLGDRRMLAAVGERARQSLFPKFDSERRARQIEALYDRVAGGPWRRSS